MTKWLSKKGKSRKKKSQYKTKVSSYTTCLFSNPTFFSGLASSYSTCGNYYTFHYSATEREADFRALYCDWMAVGEDLDEAIKKELRANNFHELLNE
jgi:hypothetical protein